MALWKLFQRLFYPFQGDAPSIVHDSHIVMRGLKILKENGIWRFRRYSSPVEVGWRDGCMHWSNFGSICASLGQSTGNLLTSMNDSVVLLLSHVWLAVAEGLWFHPPGFTTAGVSMGSVVPVATRAWLQLTTPHSEVSGCVMKFRIQWIGKFGKGNHVPKFWWVSLWC